MDRQLKRKGILFVIIGPTGSGKSTFCGRLVQDFVQNLHYSISVTSRAPRANEVPGKSYHFVSRDEFVARRDRGDFFEWEETHGNLYGTLRSNLENGIDQGIDLLFQIDIRGAMSLKRAFPENTVSVFLVPPSFEALKARLAGRGTVDPQELQRRFSTAREEYSALRKLSEEHGKIDYLVLNHDLDDTYSQIRSIVVAERSRYHRMDQSSVSQFCEVNDVGA
jgi:guanylate kinase